MNKIKEIYKETKNTVKQGEKISDGFYTSRVLRQGCQLNPSLFSTYINNIDDVIRKVQMRGLW